MSETTQKSIEITQLALMNQLFMQMLQQQEQIKQQSEQIRQQAEQIRQQQEMLHKTPATTQHENQKPQQKSTFHLNTSKTGMIIAQVLDNANAYDKESAMPRSKVIEDGSDLTAKWLYQPKEFLDFMDSVLIRMIEIRYIQMVPKGYYLTQRGREKYKHFSEKLAQPRKKATPEKRTSVAKPVKVEKETKKTPREVKAEKRTREAKPEVKDIKEVKETKAMFEEEDKELIRNGLFLCAIYGLNNRYKFRSGFRENEIWGETERVKDIFSNIHFNESRILLARGINDGYINGESGEYTLSPKGKRHTAKIIAKCKQYQEMASSSSSTTTTTSTEEPAKKRRKC